MRKRELDAFPMIEKITEQLKILKMCVTFGPQPRVSGTWIGQFVTYAHVAPMLRSCFSTPYQSTSSKLYLLVCPMILYCTEDRSIRHYNQCPNAVDNRYCYFLLKELMAKTGLWEKERENIQSCSCTLFSRVVTTMNLSLSRAITTVMITHFTILSVMVICTNNPQTPLDFPVLSWCHTLHFNSTCRVFLFYFH